MRPYISIDPAQRFGRPVINRSGISVESVTEHYWAGDDPEAIYGEWGIGRAELLVACWHQAVYGSAVWRKRWGSWVHDMHTLLAKGDYEAIPDPPRSNG